MKRLAIFPIPLLLALFLTLTACHGTGVNVMDNPSDESVTEPAYTSDESVTEPAYAGNESAMNPVYTSDVYAVLYKDGTLVFQHGDTPEFGQEVIDIYAVDMEGSYDSWDYTPANPAPWYAQGTLIEKVEFSDKIQPKSTAWWFCKCENLTEIRNIENLDTSNVNNMGGMFYDCEALTALDVSGFDTSNVTETRWMFSGCSSLTVLDVSNFKTPNVTDTSGMFDGCSSLTRLNVSSFDTSNVIQMCYMFRDCEALAVLDVSNFDTSNVYYMGGMFCGCSSLKTLDLSSFDTSNVSMSMDDIFTNCSSLVTIYVSEKFITDNVTGDNAGLFGNCWSLIGGAGTHYEGDSRIRYAHIDGGAANPGYFTAKT